jgi:hypothetical protein
MTYPVHSAIDVIEGNDIYKNEEWWKAALVYERYGLKIGVYLWHKEDGDWKRKQKYVVRDVEDWANDRAAIEELLPHLDDEVNSDSGSPKQDSKVDDLVDEALGSGT